MDGCGLAQPAQSSTTRPLYAARRSPLTAGPCAWRNQFMYACLVVDDALHPGGVELRESVVLVETMAMREPLSPRARSLAHYAPLNDICLYHVS